MSLSEEEVTTINARLFDLRQEHRDLDIAIDQLAHDPSTDQVMLIRLKRRRLGLKDMVSRLESQLIPDLNA